MIVLLHMCMCMEEERETDLLIYPITWTNGDTIPHHDCHHLQSLQDQCRIKTFTNPLHFSLILLFSILLLQMLLFHLSTRFFCLLWFLLQFLCCHSYSFCSSVVNHVHNMTYPSPFHILDCHIFSLCLFPYPCSSLLISSFDNKHLSFHSSMCTS